MIPVAHHKPMPGLIDQIGVTGDVIGDLSLQRRCQHLPSTIADELVEYRPAHTAPALPQPPLPAPTASPDAATQARSASWLAFERLPAVLTPDP